MVFVNSMSDLFHKDIPQHFIQRVFDTMERASWHTFQVLTKRIHWVIAGGESGPNFRPMQEEWAVDVRDQCASAQVAFFFKQWGGRTHSAGNRLPQGRSGTNIRREENRRQQPEQAR